MKFQTFEEYQKRINQEINNWSENSGTVESLNEMNEIMIMNREFCDHERADLEQTANTMSREFKTDVVARKIENRQHELDKLISVVKDETKKEIRTMIKRKGEMMANMLKTPPDESTLNLLNVLNLRKNITEDEIAQLSAICFDNYQAVQALASIAEQNGINMKLPNQFDIRTLFNGLKDAERFLLAACDDMCKSKTERNPRFNAFYSRSKEAPEKIQDPKYAGFAELLDRVPQLQEVKTEKTHLTPTETAKIDWYFRGVKGAKTELERLTRAREVIDNHADEIPLIRLSEYAPLLEIVEMANNSEGEE